MFNAAGSNKNHQSVPLLVVWIPPRHNSP